MARKTSTASLAIWTVLGWTAGFIVFFPISGW
jgi:hypothetical protein